MAMVALLAGMTAAQIKYVAVVETEMDARSDASSKLNAAEVSLITTELRKEAVKNLPQNKYKIMTTETVQAQGGAVLEECADENCVITLGSKIGADYIVRGIISKFQTKLTLSVEMYETENGTLVGSSESVRSENAGELLEMATAASAEMYRKFAGEQMQTAGAGQSTGGGYTANTHDSRSYLRDQDDDFTIGQRFGTWGLNLLPGGLGSFLVMKDYLGGGILFGSDIVFIIGWYVVIDPIKSIDLYEGRAVAMGAIVGGQIFNMIRSAIYHKPKPKSSPTAANFKPHDGLNLSILPTESGAYKVFARYDYSF